MLQLQVERVIIWVINIRFEVKIYTYIETCFKGKKNCAFFGTYFYFCFYLIPKVLGVFFTKTASKHVLKIR